MAIRSLNLHRKSIQPYISRLEHGHFNPSLRMVVKISIPLNMSVTVVDDRKTEFLVDLKIR
ncbi:MAG: helix-turn-helix transcriptional regulator [Ruminococcus sp.]|nr:helix-turn-helix transcriptional regulator [Ruminococcus sp.]